MSYFSVMAFAVYLLLLLSSFVAVIGQMLARREEFGLVTLPGGKLFAMGGSNVESDSPLKSTELYDPSTEKWTSGPSMITVRTLRCMLLCSSCLRGRLVFGK